MNKLTNSEIKENKNNNLNSITQNRADSESSQLNHKTEIFNNQIKSENDSATKIIHLNESDKLNSDVHKLRHKIQEQAIRLQKLEQYKYLCENRILQLDPAHPLPIQENHLKKHLKESKTSNKDINKNPNLNANNYNNNNYEEKEKALQENIYTLNHKLHALTEELKAIQSKNNFLEETLKNLTYSNNDFINKAFDSQSTKIGFPLPPDKIPNESLRENYHKLFILHNDYLDEKNQILESLKIETINNEEQKNYIEILKQTIDSFVLKNGFANCLNKIKKSFYMNNKHSPQTPNDVDFLTEITQQRIEAEKSRKELVLSQALINELKREIDFLKQNNANMSSTKEKIIDNLENGIKELDQAKNKLKSVESENANIKKEIEILRESIINLQEELKFSNEFADKLQNEKEELNNKYMEIKEHLENSQTMQNKIFDYKKSFDHIYIELNEALSQKKLIEAELYKIKNDLENQIIENIKIKEEAKIIDFERKSSLTEKDNCSKQISLLEKINKEMEDCQKAKENNINNLKDKFDKSIRDSNIIKEIEENKYEKLKKEFDEHKSNSQKTIENFKKKLEEKIEELLNCTNIKRAAYEKVKVDSINSNNDSTQIKEIEEENNYLINKMNSLQKELSNKNEISNKINQQYDNLCFDFNQQEVLTKKLNQEKENALEEIIYWKKKYDNDTMNKINEIQILNKTLDNYQKENSEKQEVIEKLRK